MRLLNWNLEWRTPGSRKGSAIARRISAIRPDLAVLTEVAGNFFETGASAYSDTDWGYRTAPSRRKVHIWSRFGWDYVDSVGSGSLPGGRYVSGVTRTELGPLRVIGVCIPWWGAHVGTGRKNRSNWQDHLAFLRALEPILEGVREPYVLAGDWNQRIPRKHQPKEAFRTLMRALPKTLEVVTSGLVPPLERPLIDHVALSKGLTAARVQGLPREDPALGDLTDHDGVLVDIAAVGSGER